ncbi:MAG TPA: LamG-like jellyroll fold domain-containing protein [Thermoanaerobaculia bacterium]|nr:LamG-like jellyroll fold domain-containing protein [Thermoanaerobaculia bacterium]
MTSSTPKSSRKTWLLSAAFFVIIVGGLGAWWARGHKDSVRAALHAVDPSTDAPPAKPAGPEVSSPEYARLGEGFLVWESNRSGPWRIWTRRLDGSGLRQLTPDESGHEHCCAHISPDGKQVAYLSLSKFKYGGDPEEGELHVIAPDGKGDRVVAARAQTYSRGHRAAIWHGDQLLQFVDGDANAVLLDLAKGTTEKLAGPSSEGKGWLVNRARTHATTGLPTFSLFDAARHAVTERTPYGGCEPYFSDDGRWGIWMAGAGGPVRAFDLATRTPKTLFEKNDPRLGEQAYIYFPMLSNGSALVAFGASANEHDHEKGNYDVFVAEVDPRTMEVLGKPLKYTSAPTPDRYPDVHVEPLPLGRTFGEAPFHVHLEASQLGSGAIWDFGDGAPPSAARGEHTYERPGSFAVSARSADGSSLRGRVTVLPAQPPHALRAELRQGREIFVSFDEPVAAAPGGVKARLASGRAIAKTAVGTDGRTLIASLAEDLTAGDHLHLEGIVDRAQRPNALVPVDLEIPPPSWPADRKSLILLWDTADQPNLVPDPSQPAERTYAVTPHGRARLNHDHAMLLVGDGAFQAEDEAGKSLVALAEKSNEITLEMTLTPSEVTPSASGIILSFGRYKGAPLFQLEQQGDALVWRLLHNKSLEPPARFGKLVAGQPIHVIAGYGPGHQVVYVNGVKGIDGDAWQGDFYFWKPGALSFGTGHDKERPWKGVIEGVALYDRLLGPDDAAENARRYAAERARRTAVPQTRVLAALQRCSRTPTLDEIAPYRQALAVCEYRLDRVLSGTAAGPTIRVARWVILDGATLNPAPGAAVPLTLEPFSANGQLESIYLSNDLGGSSTSPLFYDPTSG